MGRVPVLLESMHHSGVSRAGEPRQYVARQPQVAPRPWPGPLLLIRQIRLPLRELDDAYLAGPAAISRRGADYLAQAGARQGWNGDGRSRVLPSSPARERIRQPLRLRPAA